MKGADLLLIFKVLKKTIIQNRHLSEVKIIINAKPILNLLLIKISLFIATLNRLPLFPFPLNQSILETLIPTEYIGWKGVAL